jgi:hypothetical protein
MEEIKAKEEEKKGCCQDSKAKPKKVERTVRASTALPSLYLTCSRIWQR